jgi:murein DD-endopeptidase MepM/ murein hydrolase activator NlpD
MIRSDLMFFSTYYYNPKTCRYERVKLRWFDALAYVLGVILTGTVFFAGILALQNRIVKTENEIELRQENAMLDKHKSQVTAQLIDIESTLNQLQSKDKELSAKLFDASSDFQRDVNSSFEKSEILQADAAGARSIMDTLRAKSSALAKKSASSNAFGRRFNLHTKEIDLLQAMPSLMPVTEKYSDYLASGFGTRIHPFHKGLFHHPGIDFVAPRGTDVRATGSGEVVAVHNSKLEAGYGNYVEIDHGHGFVTRYAHLEEIRVRYGQHIDKGMPLGTVGSSGGSVAPHVHYEVIRDGENANPVHFMIERLSSADYKKLTALAKKQNQSLD